MLESFLEFDRMHENKIFFSFCFLKREINLKVLRFVFEYVREILEKIRYFNTGFISYNVKI
jgi:hypothetical protein